MTHGLVAIRARAETKGCLGQGCGRAWVQQDCAKRIQGGIDLSLYAAALTPPFMRRCRISKATWEATVARRGVTFVRLRPQPSGALDAAGLSARLLRLKKVPPGVARRNPGHRGRPRQPALGPGRNVDLLAECKGTAAGRQQQRGPQGLDPA